MIVLDNSVVIDWLVEPSVNPAMDDFITRHRHSFLVPALFWSELVYVLGKEGHRRRISPEFRARCIRRAIALNPTTDMESASPGSAFERAIDMMGRHSLTIYDAVYLELAQRRGEALATLDKKLALATRAAGLDVLPA